MRWKFPKELDDVLTQSGCEGAAHVFLRRQLRNARGLLGGLEGVEGYSLSGLLWRVELPLSTTVLIWALQASSDLSALKNANRPEC